MRKSPGFLRDAVTALSLTNLCFIKVWLELLSHDFNSYYITETPPTAGNLYGAVLNVIVTGAVILSLVRICRRYAGDRLDAPGKICFLLVVLVFLNGLRMQFWHLFLEALGKTGAMVLLGGLTLGAGALLAGYRSTYRPARTFVLLAGPFILLTFSQAVVIAQDPAVSRGLRGKSPNAAASTRLSSQRVVILVYDEMDYRITFVDRPARVFLPELDRLRRETSFFTHAFPPAGGTLLSIPALITGKMVAGASTSRLDDLLLTFKDGATSPWSSMSSIFTEAKAAGVDSAVVGCYHPYCRVVGDTLSYCAAYPPTNAGLLESMLRQWRRLTPFYLRQQHMERYRFVQCEAKKVVADPRFGLVFVHLPVPHGPAIYDGMHDRFTLFGNTVSDNIDNLRLADRSLGELRKAMEDSGVWPYTAVILTADHWWRTSRSYDGREDHRVPFIVRTTGLEGREDVHEPFCTVSLPAVVRCLFARNGHGQACDVLSAITGNTGHLPSGPTKRAGIW